MDYGNTDLFLLWYFCKLNKDSKPTTLAACVAFRVLSYCETSIQIWSSVWGKPEKWQSFTLAPSWLGSLRYTILAPSWAIFAPSWLGSPLWVILILGILNSVMWTQGYIMWLFLSKCIGYAWLVLLLPSCERKNSFMFKFIHLFFFKFGISIGLDQRLDTYYSIVSGFLSSKITCNF